jgi:hypothetical protein
VRSIIRLTLATAAVSAIACGKSKAPTAAMSEELKRDLQLATAQPTLTVSPDELAPRSQQEMALKPKKAPGPRVIRSATPTLKASEAPREVAEIQTEIPQVQVVASAPSESESPAPSAPPAARPAPVPMPTYPGPGTNTGAGNGGESGGGIGAVLGAIFGGGGGHGGVVEMGVVYRIERSPHDADPHAGAPPMRPLPNTPCSPVV